MSEKMTERQAMNNFKVWLQEPEKHTRLEQEAFQVAYEVLEERWNSHQNPRRRALLRLLEIANDEDFADGIAYGISCAACRSITKVKDCDTGVTACPDNIVRYIQEGEVKE